MGMGMLTWTIIVLVSLYSLFTSATSSTQLMSNQAQDDFNICDIVYCGKGACSSIGLFGFTCDCESGWKKPKIGSVELPPCVIPNCTVNLDCGNGSPAPSFVPPTQNSDNPCLLNFCGDGTCVSQGGSDFRCECNEGSDNLLNDPKLFCYKKCTFGGDCSGLNLGFGSDESPTSGTAGSGETLSCTRELHMLPMMTTILALIFQIFST